MASKARVIHTPYCVEALTAHTDSFTVRQSCALALTHQTSGRKRGLICGSSVFMMTSALSAPILIQIKPFAHDGCNGVHFHTPKTRPKRSVWYETHRRARSGQMNPKQRFEALRPVRSIGRITAFARDGCMCRIAHIEPDVGSTPVFHEKQRGRHQSLTACTVHSVLTQSLCESYS